MAHSTEFGVVGLGKMGAALAHQALDKGMRVVGFDLHEPPAAVRDAGLVVVDAMNAFRDQLSTPRIVFVYVPAGPAIDKVLDALGEILEPGDILVDGGNSYWGDSMRRYERLKERGVRFVDMGTSGGVEGARHGGCFMIGGDQDAVDVVQPIVTELAVEKGVVHAGPPGSGHFVKLVHNGIEFGMLQAIGEGMALLEKFQREFAPIDIDNVLECWNHGSVIRSWLIELMGRSYRAEGGLTPIPPFIEDTGEVNWLINDAMHMEVPVPVMAQSVMQLFASRDDQQNWARAIAMMRHEFGGHPFGHDEGIVKERREGRVGPFPEPAATSS